MRRGLCPSNYAGNIVLSVIWLDLVVAFMQKTMTARRSCSDSTNRVDGVDHALLPVQKALIA
jgi:hypothetical protein